MCEVPTDVIECNRMGEFYSDFMQYDVMRGFSRCQTLRVSENAMENYEELMENEEKLNTLSLHRQLSSSSSSSSIQNNRDFRVLIRLHYADELRFGTLTFLKFSLIEDQKNPPFMQHNWRIYF